MRMFARVLVANRGEIACRILRTLKRLRIASVAVYSDADCYSAHVTEADEAIRIGPGPAHLSYLRQDELLRAARTSGAQAVHPGYGFLSENADFAAACAAAGVVFIGPTADQMRNFGLKHLARDLAARHGVLLLPGSGLLRNADEARFEAARIGYPVMLKSTAGGGGIGMQLARRDAEIADAYEAVERLAAKNFSRGGVFLEKYIERARHIEVQIFGDGVGGVVALGERDCSTQRRNQKIIEETPAPGLSAAMRSRLHDSAVRLAKAVNYQSAGTVEFVYDVSCEQFYFLEVNTRLQVEHGVTEEVTGVDLVEWMLRQAAGEKFALRAPPPRGASIQVRVYAEDPARQFRPSSGLITHARFPADVRVETWIADGTEVTPLYDPLLAKIIAVGADRAEALAKLQRALTDTSIVGIETNLDYLRALLAEPTFARGAMTTRALESFAFAPRSVEVLAGGTQTTIQDYPGRLGYWNVGVPPSGPMDEVSFRLVNQAVGNRADAPALEITVSGPSLRFDADAVICLGGAAMSAEVGSRPVPFWQPTVIRAGELLRIGSVAQSGCRAYLAVRGGFDCPAYLASRATFTLGKFGGHGGRALAIGDILHVGNFDAPVEPLATPADCIPRMADHWELGVLYGPHGAPDFFKPEDIDAFFAADWEVHYNSNRTGVRLIGPKPTWARADGGEAGLHPSNIHDNAYAVGAVDFTGDMPVILGPDGPSLGGFVCPATLVKAELWKLGQLRPNNRIRFRRLTPDEAARAEEAQELMIERARADVTLRLAGDAQDGVAPRSAGDAHGGVAPRSAADAKGGVAPRSAGDAHGGVAPRPAGNANDGVAPRPAGDAHGGVAPRSSADANGGRHGVDAPILASLPARGTAPAVIYRRAGDKYLLVEYGPLVLDLELRLRVHALMAWLEEARLPGVIELTPGIRSLQVHYESRVLPLTRLLEALGEAEKSLAAIDDMAIATRVVHLPLSWDDAATQLAIAKYMQSVRADAPWCPSNIEFIRRVNGLDSVDDVKRIVFDASYLVLGLGDVYLGAPVATPIDPRHRLVTTKYNPARTWTPENAVGIGGAYLCVYGMEGPGGYQFVGRTCQMWNTYRVTREFPPGQPWLLRFFDQIRFYPVSGDELLQFRADFLHGRVHLKISDETFHLKDYRQFLDHHADSIAAHKARQQAAFDAERRRWEASGQIGYAADLPAVLAEAEAEKLLPDEMPVASPVSGSVWKISVAVGQTVQAGDLLVTVESMKMELPVTAPTDGVVSQIRCAESRAVTVAQTLVVLRS
jgi:urea carboxylase